jgi:hypothetical protein
MMNESEQNDSDDSSSLGIPLVVMNDGDVQDKPKIPEKMERPPDGLRWKDDAILDCFNLGVTNHFLDQPTEWVVPSLLNRQDNEFLANWKPASLPLPIWAVDSFSHPKT